MEAKQIYFKQRHKNKMLLEGLSYSNNPDYKTLKCGNIDFNEDYWDLSDFTPRELDIKYCNIVFYGIKSRIFKNTIKQYAWYLIGNTTSKNKFQSIPNKISTLISSLVPFMEEYKISSLKRFNKKHFEKYLKYLEENKKKTEEKDRILQKHYVKKQFSYKI